MNCILVHPFLNDSSKNNIFSTDIDEFFGLVEALRNVRVCGFEKVNIKKINASTFLGNGKIEDIKVICTNKNIKISFFNCILSPIQQRNLENLLNTKVLDRHGLILEIFGDRAITKEGTLQVELAHLKYQKSRLVRSWTHLERQKGGVGFVGGPGETQIESDRRQINNKIYQINKRLKKVVKTRNLHRDSRKRKDFLTISLIGYTNSGKSSIFNKLTRSKVNEKNMPFSTLDTTMRTINLKKKQKIIISDTVGFISNLPLELISAFKSTLEEISFSDVILHVRDISNPYNEFHYKNVKKILNEIDKNIISKKIFIEVWNKIDLLEKKDLNYIKNKFSHSKKVILVSAKKNLGFEYLENLLVKSFLE